MINFSTSVAEDKWLFSENNKIFEFESDSVKTPLYCDVTFLTYSIRLYPHPDGSFWVNLKNYLSVQLNSYADNLDFSSIDELGVNTFVFDWSRVFINETITFTITFTDLTTESSTKTPKILLGGEDLKAYKRGETIKDLVNPILSPLKKGTQNRFYLKYWDGYPFDFTYASAEAQTITNNTTLNVSPTITMPSTVNRIVLSDGDFDISDANFLPIVIGYNELQFTNSTFIDLWKIESGCGVYLKFLNKSGGFNYWLFNEQHERKLSSKSIGSINNDFYNIENTYSPEISLGRTSNEVLTIGVDSLNADDINVLSQIASSPKIYLFTGQRFSRSSFNDWIEIELENKEIVLRDFKGHVPNITLTIKLPEQQNVRL